MTPKPTDCGINDLPHGADARLARLVGWVLAGLALLAAQSPLQAAPCERWYVAGDWDVKDRDDPNLWVGMTIQQQGTQLSGDASFIQFKSFGKQGTDEGSVSGSIAGEHINFRIVWRKQAPADFEGNLNYDYAKRRWGAIGTGAGGRVGWRATFDAYCARAAVPPGMEDNTDRFGADLESFALISTPNGDVRGRTQDQPNGEWGPQVCQRACLRNIGCKAWTLVWAGMHQPNSVCHLKGSAPRPTANACCVSGMVFGRAGEADAPVVPPSTNQVVAPGMEDNTDRPGADYYRDEIFPDRRNPEGCQRQCLTSDRCRAWTYVRPGVQGTNGFCYLKYAVPKAVVNPCCISGVKPSAMGPGGVTDPGPLVPTPPNDGKRMGPGGAPEPGPFVPTPPNPGGAASEAGPGFARVPSSAGCRQPFVQRRARESDAACVTRDSFATVQNENASAASRWDAKGAYGPHTCIAGFVWREAFDGDTVCVTPARRAEVKEENRLAPTRAAAQERPFEPGRANPAALSPGDVKAVISLPEANTDRPGSDYENYRMDDAHHCRAACVSDKRCQAWTFVRAGIHGPTGVCYLKRPAPPPVANTCCISGTVTR